MFSLGSIDQAIGSLMKLSDKIGIFNLFLLILFELKSFKIESFTKVFQSDLMPGSNGMY